MKAIEIYRKLNDDFIKKCIKDVDWAKRMPVLEKYLFPEFKQNGGIVYVYKAKENDNETCSL